MIQNIVFDMGQVLLRFDAESLARKYTKNDEDAKVMLQEVFRTVEWIKTDRGTLTPLEASENCKQRVPDRLHQAVENCFLHWHDELILIPEMEELILSLKKSSYRIYLLSNTSIDFYKYKDKIPALQYFDGLFISADWHLLKPDSQIYDRFCSHFSLIPLQCFFVDDSPVNIESALLCGWNGAIFDGDTEFLKRNMKKSCIRFS